MVTAAALDRLVEKLRLTTPLIGVYDAPPSAAFAPLVETEGTLCCFAHYARWMKGETLVLSRGGAGCQGAYRALGLGDGYPPHMAHFLTDGVGAPKGEGLKATPEIAQAYLDRARPIDASSGYVLIGPLRLDQWDALRGVTFFVDPDRLGAVMTLAGYWSADDVVSAPFGSGCSLLWRALNEDGRDRAVLGATDIAMRRHVPPDILTLSVTPQRFEQMVSFPDGAFLDRPWWNDLMDSREHGQP
jgi:Uncharacterised ArCR, COG2043